MILAQNTFTVKRLAKDEFVLHFSQDTMAIPATSAGVADLTLAEFAVKVTKGGKELFPNFDESIGGTPPVNILNLATISTFNCSVAIVGDKVKLTTLTSNKASGYVDVTVTYGDDFTDTRRFTWVLAKEGGSGQSVDKIEDQFYLSTSKTTQTGGSWVSTPPAWVEGKYLWKRLKITYKNPTEVDYSLAQYYTEWDAVDGILTDLRRVESDTEARFLQNEDSIGLVTSTVVDVLDELDDVEHRLSESEAKILVQEENINAKVSNTEFNAYGNAVSSKFSEIDQGLDDMTLAVGKKVGYDEVVASINLSPESIKIDAEKIQFTGSVSFKSASRDAVEEDILDAVQEAKEYVDDLEIGGRNYFRNINGRPLSMGGGGTTPPTVELIEMQTPFGSEAFKITFPPGNNTGYAGSRATTNYVKLAPKTNYSYFTYIYAPDKDASGINIYPTGAYGMGMLSRNTSKDIGNWLCYSREGAVAPAAAVSEFEDFLCFYANAVFTSPKIIYVAVVQFEKGNKITDFSYSPEDVQAEIDSAKQEALTAAGNAQNTANSLKDFTDTAFRDGIIDRSESIAIEKYKNSLNEAMAKAEASYNKVYTNTYLEGTAKTSLLNAKVNLWGQRDTLLSAINTAISGGTTTPAQKTAVDNAFSTFNNLMTAFQNALEEANKAIQTKLDDLSTEKVNNIQIGGRNLFSVNDFVADNKARGYSTINVINYNGNIAYRSSSITNNHLIPRYLQGKFEANTQYYLQFKINWESYTNSGTQYVIRVVYTDGTTSNLAATTSQTSRSMLTSAGKTINYITTTRQYDGTVVIYEVQIEKANKPSDWRPAIEDVQSDINKAMADANLARAITDKFGTNVTGGLITTVMMLLREANSQINTAGFSGIQKDNNGIANQPSYWSGGTYEQAMTFVPFVKKLENEQSTSLEEYNNLPSIVFLHSGAAKVGHFIVLTSGEILVVDPATGSVKLKFTTADLPAIADLVSGTNSQGSTAVGAGVASISSSQVVSGSTVVSKNGAIATFNGTHISLSARGVVQAGGMASFAEAVLYARQNGVRVQRLASVTVHFTNTVYEDKSAEVLPVPFSFPLDAGTYTFELVIHTTGTISSGNAVTSASTLSWKHTVAGVKKQQYSKDGMMFFYSNRHFYFNELTGLDVKESDSKKFNLPGVLLSATVNAGGGWGAIWGAKQSSTQPVNNSTGRYTVYHTVGHTNYQVNAIPNTSNRTCHIVSKATSNFVIEWRTVSSSPTLVNTGFDFQIIGNNYAQ